MAEPAAEGISRKKTGFWSALDARLGFSRLAYRVPRHANSLPYLLGGTALGSFLILAATGIYIAQFFDPSTPATAYQSIVYIMTKAPFGNFARSLHYWAANAFMLIILLHLIRVFISGSYKKPRELTWLTGLLLFALSLGFYFTGSSLRQDQEAVEALTHNIGIGELFGRIGTWFTSGFAVSVSIVARVFFAHITILIFFFLAVLALHLYLIKLHGISPKVTPDAVTRSTEGEGESRFTEHLKRLAGYALILFAALGVLAILFPAPLGTPGVYGAEVAKPPWPFLPFYGMEDVFGFPAVIWGPTILFTLLALVPFLDRNPYLSPRKRKPMMIYGAVILAALIALGLEGYFNGVPPPGTGWSGQNRSYAFSVPFVSRAYAHMIPTITVSPGTLAPGGRLTVSGDGMPESGVYALSIESNAGTIPLGAVTVAQGNDSFGADFTLPTSIAPGNYLVKAVAGDNRTVYSLSGFAVLPAQPQPQSPAVPSGATVTLANDTTPLQLTAILIVLAAAAVGGFVLVRMRP